jgi:hypothetical protein
MPIITPVESFVATGLEVGDFVSLVEVPVDEDVEDEDEDEEAIDVVVAR